MQICLGTPIYGYRYTDIQTVQRRQFPKLSFRSGLCLRDQLDANDPATAAAGTEADGAHLRQRTNHGCSRLEGAIEGPESFSIAGALRIYYIIYILLLYKLHTVFGDILDSATV